VDPVAVTRAFSSFMAETEPRVRKGLIAGFGPDLGYEATLEAFEYAWEHWERVRKTRNPAGYLYRVGANSAVRARRKNGRSFPLLDSDLPSARQAPWVEPKLDGALDRLSDQQRTAIVLIHGFGWKYREVAELLAVGRSTVQKHVERGLTKLRTELGVRDAVA